MVAAVHEAGALPIVYYGSFLLDRRYGLSRQTVTEWGRDHAKALGIGLVLAVGAAVFVTAALALWPSRWWILAWAAAVAVGVGLTFAAPVLLLPLFFRITPLQNEGLRRRLLALADRFGTPAIGIFEWRLSDRTSRANAALAGIGRTRCILVSDTLVADYQEDEIEVILAHELAHHVRRDVWRTLALDAAVAGVSLAIADAALRWSIEPLRLRGLSDVAALPVPLLTVMGVWLALLPVANALSRAHERRADLLALEATGNAGAFVRAMRRLGASNLAEEAPSPVVRLFFYTHPPLGDRLAFAEAWARLRQ
jgi:STE24 endopeptidase